MVSIYEYFVRLLMKQSTWQRTVQYQRMLYSATYCNNLELLAYICDGRENMQCL